MVYNKVYTLENIDFSIQDIKTRQEPRSILMASPDYFDVVDVKNVYMEAQKGKINKELAKEQWNNLKEQYEKLVSQGLLKEVHIIEGVPGLEDMVFCANQSFPWQDENGKLRVIMSNMFHPSRQREVPYFEKLYTALNYEIIHLNKTSFEGMGDTIPHPEKYLIYGGYGHRSFIEAYAEIAFMLQIPIVTIELKDPRFYHLDTCFLPLSINSVLICKEAFTKEGLETLAKFFEEIIEIPMEEAELFFSLNAHVITSYNIAVIQKGSKVTKETLISRGFRVIEVDTSEFMKSGGSVFCMKMMFY